ncbi:hypothetical protein TNCV_2083001 [Trichonephila clavipes]|nr:hypothetical protein TNCV_2083001 [Trichonephila clavipes]
MVVKCTVLARASVLKTTGHNTSFCSALVPSEPRLLPACMWYAMNQSLELRRRQLSAKYLFVSWAVPSHPLKTFLLSLVSLLDSMKPIHLTSLSFFGMKKGCSK